MQQHLSLQVFSVVVAVVLLGVFYILLAANMLTGQNLLTPLMLIINAVILLAILTVVGRIEYYLRTGKKK